MFSPKRKKKARNFDSQSSGAGGIMFASVKFTFPEDRAIFAAEAKAGVDKWPLPMTPMKYVSGGGLG